MIIILDPFFRNISTPSLTFPQISSDKITASILTPAYRPCDLYSTCPVSRYIFISKHVTGGMTEFSELIKPYIFSRKCDGRCSAIGDLRRYSRYLFHRRRVQEIDQIILTVAIDGQKTLIYFRGN